MLTVVTKNYSLRSNFIDNTGMWKKMTRYLKEVRLELKKVSWPTRKETTKYTVAVIGISLAVAVFFGALDYVFSWLLNTFIL